MKKFLIILFLFILFAISFSGCNITAENVLSGDKNVVGRYSGFKKIDLRQELINVPEKKRLPEKYEVLMFTDIHVGAKYYDENTVKKFFEWLDSYENKDKISFACALGDFTDSARENQMKEYADMAEKINERGILVFNVIGNHDLFLYNGYDVFAEYCYPNTSFFRFETRKLAWYGLDSGSGTFGSKQMDDIRFSIESETKIPVIFTHIPLKTYERGKRGLYYCLRDTTERNELIGLLNNSGCAGYFCGHFHNGGIDNLGNLTQYNLKSFGEFGKWYIVDVDESGDKPVLNVKEFSAD